MKRLTIGQVAERAAVGIETIRFYERRGLIPEPPRSRAGYRQYRPDVVGRIGFIRRAKRLGFSLDEIGELLALRADPKEGCADVCTRARRKLADIEEQIAVLQEVRDELDDLIATCTAGATDDSCHILGALERADPCSNVGGRDPRGVGPRPGAGSPCHGAAHHATLKS